MKKTHVLLVSILIANIFINQAYCQDSDSVKQAKVKYISKDLAINETQAEKVVTIMDGYKLKAKAVLEDKNLKDSEKRLKLDLLIDKKNADLKVLLNEQQLQRFVPTTEKRTTDKSKTTTTKG